MKDILDKALEDVDEPGHLLMTKYKKISKKIYIIVEGYDDKIYYTNFLQDYLPDDWDYEFIMPNKSTINYSSKKYCDIQQRIDQVNNEIKKE